MTDVGMRAGDDPATILLAGDISIGAITAAHAELVEALRAHSDILATVDADASIDLSGVQLIESARRTALAAGGGFALAAPATGGLYETLRRGGFLATAEQRAFWLNAPGEV